MSSYFLEQNNRFQEGTVSYLTSWQRAPNMTQVNKPLIDILFLQTARCQGVSPLDKYESGTLNGIGLFEKMGCVLRGLDQELG